MAGKHPQPNKGPAGCKWLQKIVNGGDKTIKGLLLFS